VSIVVIVLTSGTKTLLSPVEVVPELVPLLVVDEFVPVLVPLLVVVVELVPVSVVVCPFIVLSPSQKSKKG
jgi:hypothetical protein